MTWLPAELLGDTVRNRVTVSQPGGRFTTGWPFHNRVAVSQPGGRFTTGSPFRNAGPESGNGTPGIPRGMRCAGFVPAFPISEECSYAGAYWAADDTRLNDRLGRLGHIGGHARAGRGHLCCHTVLKPLSLGLPNGRFWLGYSLCWSSPDGTIRPKRSSSWTGGRSRPATAPCCLTTIAMSSTWLCPLRNAGTGIAYLYGYRLEAEPARHVESGTLDARVTDGATWPRTPQASRATARPYVAPGENGFWRPPYATPAPPYTPPRSAPSRPSGGSRSTFSMATWKEANERSPVSSASPDPSRSGAAMWLITGVARRSRCSAIDRLTLVPSQSWPRACWSAPAPAPGCHR